MEVISFGSIKGGTGKSTILILVCRALAATGRKILAIGLDVNASLESAFLPDNFVDRDNKKHIAAALLSTKWDDLNDYIISSCIPNIDLLRVDMSLTRITPSPRQLQVKIKESNLHEKYDYVFLDTPATYYALHIMAFQASNLIITPVMLSKFDAAPVSQLGINLQIDTDNYAKWMLIFNGVRPENSSQDDYFHQYQEIFPNIISSVRVPLTNYARYAIDRQEKIGQAQNVAKLRYAICNLASFIAEEKINPEAF